MKKITRRTFLKGSLRAVASTAFAGHTLCGAPYVWAKKRMKLRVLGTHVTLQEELRRKAEKDLGIEIEFHPGGSAAILHQATTQPSSFDLYEQWSNSIKVLWQARAIQGIEIDRIKNWNEINNITKTGKLVPEAKLGKGDAPYKMLYVSEDRTLGSDETSQVSFLPYVHNVDSFGYNTKVVPEGIPYKTESWGWLLDEQWRGKVALVNAPTIGIFDAILAVEAKGLMKFRDIGNPSKEEIDTLFTILINKREEGHFRGLWSSVPQSIDLMKRGEVVIESMFSPAVSSLNGAGIPCIYAAPKEGYRAWHGVMCLSSKTDGVLKDAAYEYMNWWLSGWPGAYIARQGYYISNPQRSKAYMSQAEWDYWYLGKAAREDLRGTDGKIAVRKGEVRTGGSYVKRMSNIAVWNTVMDNYEYLLTRWGELLTI